MNSKLVVLINGQPQIEYDRNKRLPGHQRQFLDKMDADMDNGISLSGEFVTRPDIKQRALYISMHLINAITQNEDGKISAMSAYLANRLPDLKQVMSTERDGDFHIELVFDREFKNQVTVNFKT